MRSSTRISIAGHIAFLLTIMLMATSQSAAADPEALNIMTKVDSRDTGSDRTADMKIILVDKQDNKRIRRLKVFNKKKGDDMLALMFFLHPSDVKNTGFLTHDFEDPAKEDNMWLYVSALKKTKRIAAYNKNRSFMGSDLNYSDMAAMQLDDYEFDFYEKQKQHKIDSSDTWAIWCVPKSEKIARQIGYDKRLVFVRQDNFMIARILAWEHGSQYLKYFDVKHFEKIDNIWVATNMVISVKKGNELLHKTILELNNIRFNQNLNESLFTVRNLEKGL